MEPKKILFVSHDANRAGSQLLLLQLLRLLKERGVPMHLLLCNGGELESEFEEVISMTRLYQTYKVASNPFTGKLLKKVNLYKLYQDRSVQRVNEKIVFELEQQNIGLVFVNSIANSGVYHDFLKFLHHLPLVLFVHELAMSVKVYSHEKTLNFLLKKTDHLIAVSHAVAAYYIKKYDYPEKHVSTFTLIDHEHIDRKLKTIQRDILEKTYKIPKDAIVIGGCGNAEWRKGNDIFNWIAKRVIHKTHPLPVYFVWVGAGPQHQIYELIESDIRLMGLSDRIILVPPTSHALDYINRFDVLLLSSREDPYPLVVLEAALQEIPVVCFEDAGGAPELIESDAGFVVPYMDISAASEAVIQLVLDPTLRDTLGQNGRKKVLERHNTEKSVGSIEAIIQKYLPLQVSEQHNQ
ncbi:glycosyltransferase family 4 protein [Dyadobacter arcticus]|uniref:Glycosyltransferase involved in cell wall biosynthesis n=1 Tax=Dyadobacter arcticus TaxID=1078754 RepID=A0ABX0UKB2_9BACT|nr:glycosyltransferase family 4 protein [Dyadobacter arcticus]NIJ53352.1 glycosyltransferase involved in cell wall biosynthesis [Dyadobacter arcticus]